MEMFLFILEIIGTIAFAVGGSVLAIKNKMDILGVIILSIIAALGGGLLRDVMFNKDIILFTQPIYLTLSIVTALIIFIVLYSIKNIKIIDNDTFNIILNIVDGIGLGVFVVVGINAVYDTDSNYLLIIFSGLITGVGGGVCRDLMVNRIPNIFRKHIYAIAALIGSIIYLLFVINNLTIIGSLFTITFVTVIRILSHKFKLSLPKINLE